MEHRVSGKGASSSPTQRGQLTILCTVPSTWVLGLLVEEALPCDLRHPRGLA